MFRRRREVEETPDSGVPEELDDMFEAEAQDAADAQDTAEDPDPTEPGAPAAGAADVRDEPVMSAASTISEPYAVKVPERPRGPWDSEDLPADDEVPRLDLGAMLVPVPEGLELRIEVQDEQPVAATLVEGDSQLQVHAFAAPKSSGLWAEVRAEIAESLQGSGGSAEEVDGTFGPELTAQVPAEDGLAAARFLGVDGPRWFLRGLITGRGATEPASALGLEAAFRAIVVHRGSEAMAPRDILPIHLPREAMEAAVAGQEAADAAVQPAPDRSLQLPERGPEITETQ